MKKLLLPIFVALTLCRSESAQINIACDFSAITNALATCGEGDVITVAPGSCVLLSAITINRGVSFTFKGSGTNLTTLISTNVAAAITVSSQSSGLFTISDLNLVGHVANSSGFIFVGTGAPDTTPYTGPYRLTRLQLTNTIYRGISVGGGGAVNGLVDNCWIVSRAGASANPLSFFGNEYISWTNVNTFLGTTNMPVVEDCFVQNLSGGGGNGHWDAYNGAQFAIRHCLFQYSANTGWHGYDSQTTSTRSGEVYSNTWTNHGPAVSQSARGGTFLYYSNAMFTTGVVSVATISPQLTYYRAADSAYQGTLGFNGYAKTNQYVGTVTSATTTTVTDTNYYGLFNAKYVLQSGHYLIITGGTGAGQSNLITTCTTSNFTTSGTWSPVPDSTSTYEIGFAHNARELVGTQPYYIFTTNVASMVGFNRYVQLGGTTAASISNLVMAINQNPSGSGTAYTAITTNAANKNLDFYVIDYNATSLTLSNRLDGTNAYGWPAAFQNGVIRVVPWTNSGVTLYPNYSWNNYVDVPTNKVGFIRSFEATVGRLPNYVTNTLVLGRDYFNDTDIATWAGPPAGYAPLVYPHPIRGDFVRDIRSVTARIGTVRSP